MSFYPGFGGGISNVQCGMILPKKVGLAHQLGVIWPGEFDFEVISLVLERCVGSLASPWRSQKVDFWISEVISGSRHGAWTIEARKAIVKVRNW